jgi:hypothetical protein
MTKTINRSFLNGSQTTSNSNSTGGGIDITANLTASKPVKTDSSSSLVSANLEITEINGLQTILTALNEPTPESIPSFSHIDYSTQYPSAMKAAITSTGGGTNICYGDTATYIAGVDILAGRCVALMDQNEGSDDSEFLKVCYLKNGDEVTPSISPIGITQHNALIGETIKVCVGGFTTAICENSDTSPERGSQIIVDTANQGKMRINNTGGGNQARLGFVAQSNQIYPNDPMLIYYAGYFQPY